MLVLLTLLTLSFVVALAAPETGAVEKAVLAIGCAGLIAVAVPVRRIGARS